MTAFDYLAGEVYRYHGMTLVLVGPAGGGRSDGERVRHSAGRFLVVDGDRVTKEQKVIQYADLDRDAELAAEPFSDQADDLWEQVKEILP